jgi:hypothetical protein
MTPMPAMATALALVCAVLPRSLLRNYDTADDITIMQVGSDTVINFEYVNGSVTLVGVSAAQLLASDWLV